MLFGTVLLPEGESERKLLQLCYLLFTSPSKALTRGHCSGEEGKKKYIPILNTVEETFSSPLLLKQKQILLGHHYSCFYTFSAFVPIYLCIPTCLHLLYAFVLPRAHPPLPRAPTSVDQRSHPYASAPVPSCLPMNLFLFEHFQWHLNSSHRFPNGEGV